MATISSARKWWARVFLAFVWLWIVYKVLALLVNGVTARALDFTNPSGISIIGFLSLIGYFLVRPKQGEHTESPPQSEGGLASPPQPTNSPAPPAGGDPHE